MEQEKYIPKIEDKKSKRILFLKTWAPFLLIAFILIAVFFWFNPWQKEKSLLDVQDLDKNYMPEKVASDFSFDVEESLVLDNFLLKEDESGLRKQYSKRYITDKSLGESYEELKKYVSNSKWEIKNEIDQENIKGLTASKEDGTQALISVSQNEITGEVVADLTVIYWGI